MHGVLKLGLVSSLRSKMDIKFRFIFVQNLVSIGKFFVNFHHTVIMLMIRICTVRSFNHDPPSELTESILSI